MSVKSALLGSGLSVQRVETPEWPEGAKHVHVRELDCDELEGLAKLLEELNSKDRKRGKAPILGDLCAILISDKNGKQVFADGDGAKLGKRSGNALMRVCLAGMNVNAQDEQSQDEIRNQLKNRPGTERGSNSPANGAPQSKSSKRKRRRPSSSAG